MLPPNVAHNVVCVVPCWLVVVPVHASAAKFSFSSLYSLKIIPNKLVEPSLLLMGLKGVVNKTLKIILVCT